MLEKINGGQRYGGTGVSKSGSRTSSENTGTANRTEPSAKADTVDIGSRKEASVTYSKTPKKQLDAPTIEALQAEAEKTTENLRKLVEQLILKQNKNYKASINDSAEDSAAEPALTAEDIEAAKLAISEDGEFGVKAVSDRLVDFAISISGGDKSKLSELVSAIDEGFDAAKKALGGYLPDICSQTYDETMKKLNDWANETDS
ncbi:MAG TPA: hypothetical protein VN381_13215 [Anaerovoracaceae bacterium]|nr:hypothetical protein [Anaerovoracaceae bacterium]